MGILIYGVHFTRDKPTTHLKPGQKSLERDYYGVATHESPDGKACLSNYGRFDSIYNKDVNAAVTNTDYKVPNKNANTMCKLLWIVNFLVVSYDYAHNQDL